jgi:hypothetical protein
MLNIPAKYPAHTRTWLNHLDAVCSQRALMEHTDKLDQAYELLAHSGGNTAYFARLYVGLLEKAVRS